MRSVEGYKVSMRGGTIAELRRQLTESVSATLFPPLRRQLLNQKLLKQILDGRRPEPNRSVFQRQGGIAAVLLVRRDT